MALLPKMHACPTVNQLIRNTVRLRELTLEYARIPHRTVRTSIFCVLNQSTKRTFFTLPHGTGNSVIQRRELNLVTR